MGRAALTAPSVCDAEAPELRLQHAQGHPRKRHEPFLKLGAGQCEAPERHERDDVGGGRLIEQNRQLAEEIAPRQLGPLLSVDSDRGLALEDDVEARAAEALPQDALPLVEPLLLERVGDGLELRSRQVPEQREAREGVGKFLSVQVLTSLVSAG